MEEEQLTLRLIRLDKEGAGLMTVAMDYYRCWVVAGTCLGLAFAESAALVLVVHFGRRGAGVYQVEAPELGWSHAVPE